LGCPAFVHASTGRGGRGGPRRGGDAEKDAWNPITKLGRLVKARKIDSLEHIFLYSMPIKEYQIIDHFFPKVRFFLSLYPFLPHLLLGSDQRRGSSNYTCAKAN
jgi:hypothetical protein